MNADRASGTSDFPVSAFQSISKRIDWKKLAVCSIAAFFGLMVGSGAYPLLGPDETRHAGIVHDMWAARQYVMPRVNGLPLLDGAPLHYWVTLAFLFLFGAEEWVLRMPSAVAAALTLAFVAKFLSPWPFRRSLATLCALFLLQPAFMIAGRLAVPDMLNVLLLTLAAGSFRLAAYRVERGRRPEIWVAAAWAATGLLGLGAGPFAMCVPVLMVCLWLVLRGRYRLLRTLCWWPGPAAAALMVLPWLCAAASGNPGIVAAILERPWQGLWNPGERGWDGSWLEPRAGLLLAAALPLAACLYRYRHPARRAALRTPTAGFMAAWLAVLAPLHPLVAMTAVGPAALAGVPLLYFSVLALAPVENGRRGAQAMAWLLYAAVAVAAALAARDALAPGVSDVPPVARIVSVHYRPAIDKVIMLDRYDYEFNFYMRSPKLVFVAAEWGRAGEAFTRPWMKELVDSGRYAPEVAQRLLLTHGAFLDRLCGRRVVNLWVIADEHAPLRHPILSDLTSLQGTGKVRAWYLDAEAQPASCGDMAGVEAVTD